MRVIAPLALALSVAAAPVLADTVTGEVLSFDPAKQLLVLDDRTVWSLKDGGLTLSEALLPGQTVEIVFTTNGDSGFGKILRVAVLK